jgi:hypothetical protein
MKEEGKNFDLDSERNEIRKLGLDAIKGYFGVNPTDMDTDTLKHLHQKAKIGMQFEREMCVDRRSIEMNYLRVFKMIAEDKQELKKYIRSSMPKYYPVSK